MLETKLSVPFYGHVRQYHSISAEIDTKMQEVLGSGQYVLGPMLKRFEAELAQFYGTRYAIGVGNGTDALFLVLRRWESTLASASPRRTRFLPPRRRSG